MVQAFVIISLMILGSVFAVNAEPFADYLQNEEQENVNYERLSRSDQDDRDAFIQKESQIVQDVYSPDYYEPNIILDYRYLKSGGREYTRSDGGQILILPRKKYGQVKHNNYDVLLEHLRKKRLAEFHKLLGNNSNRKPNGFEMKIPEYYEVIEEAVEEEGGYLRNYRHRG